MDTVCPAVRLTPGTTPVRWDQHEWNVPASGTVAFHWPSGARFSLRLLPNAAAMVKGFEVEATIYDVEARLTSCSAELPDLTAVEALSRRAIMAFICKRAMWWPCSDWDEGEPPPNTLLRKPGLLLVRLAQFGERHTER